ncbi:VCBS domain-containing protein, partial [Vibrio splendidus]|uniref:VCBS domain-containing protein n=1 Tax=Vibrio splendidus TaxID=29497 RepID=UPI003D0B97F8
VGDKVEETFTVSSIDGTPSIIKVTINGTNDAATVSTATVSVDETDKAVTTSGTLTSTDVDNPDNAFTPDSISGTNGDLTIDANGHWVFTANNAFNQLNLGDKVEETFTVTSVDGTPSTIKVTINGANDAATVSSASVAVDETDTAISTSGTLTSTDVDNPDNTFTPDAITGTNGNLTIDANGHWTFTANSAFNQLNVGDKVDETFTVASVDGTPSTIKVTINGTNDKAAVSSATVAIDETDKAVITSGTLISVDVDNQDNAFTPDSIAGTIGGLTIDANGHWTFTANSAFNQLNVGDKVEETFTVNSVDGTPSTIKVTINGTNDAATVSTATVAIDETDKAVTTSGTLTSTDVDNPDNTFTPDSISGTNGNLTIDANGHWVFTANSAFNQLNVGDKVEETFTVNSVDGTPSTIKVTINGTNDAATVSTATVAVDETDTAVTTSGTLTNTDIDNPDNTFTPDSISGTNGDLTIDANGHWNFTANSVFNQLNIGDKVEETFTVSSVDGTPSTIKITINGTNDKATVSSATVTIDETDKAVTTSGTLTSTDVDNPDNTFTPDSISGTNGNLTIDASGHWMFTANSAFNQLNVGDKVEETFTVSSIDGTPSTIKVTINGTNDKATLSSATVAIDETDKAVTTSGTLTSTDIDNPDNAFTPDSIIGTNGNLNIDAHGQWIFTANSAFNQLNVGDKVEETFTVSSIDGTPSTIKVTINGTNDKATVSSATVVIDETNKAVTASGTLTSIDVDNPDNTFTPDSISGTNGNLTIDANGHWAFTANSAFNQLNVGDKVEETFTVSSVDGTPSTIKITINGTNDKATVSSANVAVDETDTAVTTSGTLTSTDVDNPDNTFTPDSISGTNGNLTIDVNGHWVFTANSAFNQLNVGDKVEETFTVSSIDGTPSTIKITINGTNDAATLSSATVAIDETDTAVTTSGTLTSTDVDNPDNTFTPDLIAGTNGNLNIDAHGNWTFTANSAFNQLNVGDKVEETFTVSSIDGTPSTIKVTINGTNDKATVSSASVAIDETDKAVTTSGTLTSTDVDNPDNTFTPDSITGTNGNLNIDAHGQWTFTANNAFNQLNVGDKVEETFTVNSVDGTPSTIKVTINGTNDKATVSSATVAIDETDKAVTTSGTLTSTDVDNPDNTFTPDSITGTNGNLNIDAHGQWTFTANSAFNQLNVGDKVEETFTVSSVDGTPSSIKVTINGTNDAATISSATVAIDETDKAVTTSGTLTSTDVDNPDNTFTPDSIVGSNGDLTIDANGHWVFTANNAFNQLNVGDKVEETFTVSSIDGTPSKIKITINGTNDTATVSTATVSVDETDKAVTTSGTLTSTDVDNPDNTFTPDSIVGANGDLTIDANGHWVFTANSAFNQLNVGDKVEEIFTVSSIDGTPSTIKVTINGTNDAATVSTATVSVDETDKAVTASGTLTSTDVDNPDNTFTPDSIVGANGDLTIDSNGHWVFTANSAFNQLNVGDKVEETFTVSSIDGTPSTIRVTINGTNDKPTIAAQSHSVTEDGQLLQGQMVGSDIDNGAQLTYSVANPVDGLTLNKDGSYIFDPANSTYQQLADKQTQTITIPVTVTDEHNSSSTENLTIIITGTGDSAIIGGVDTGSVIEKTAGDNMSPDFAHSGMATLGNSVLSADGQLTIVDPDKGEQGFASHTNAYNYHGTYGDLILNPDGSWHYVADAGSVSHIGGRPTTRGTAIDQLGKGDTLTDTITVHSIDGTTHDIVITINGSNDRPYCSSEVQLNSGKEDAVQTITTSELLSNSVDVDSNDAGKLSVANLHADHGSIRDNHNGTFTFTPNHNYNGNIHFTYDVVDAHSGTTHTGANTTITGTPDQATITEVTTGSVTEDGTHATHNNGITTELAYGQLQVIDPDSGENKFQYSQFGETSIHDPFGGMLRIDSAGNWGYSVDNAALQHLAQGQTETVVYRVHSYDGTAYDLHIDVTGTNDAPAVNKVVLSNGTEDTHYQMQASQFGFTDIDTKDTLHSISITDLPPATQGKFVLYGHDISSGQSIATADISKLQFVPAQDFNGDVQFKYTVNDGHVNSQKATNTLHIDAVSDAAKITGTDTGNVHEGHTFTAPDGSMSGSRVNDRSPDHQHHNTGKLWNDQIHTKGHLNIHDADSGEAHAQNGVYHGHYGQIILQENGDWSYYASIGQDSTGRSIDKLGQGQNLTDTITIKSADGTAHNIVITIHGSNDRPYCSSEVQLNAGTEDTRQTITIEQLLHNTVDVDNNDTGLLTVENLHADHGSIAINSDGSFSFTPEKNYNGNAHFSYDVRDAHGGVTHTGAITSLGAINDNPDNIPVVDSVTEDTDTHHIINLLAGATDVDGDALSISQIQASFEGSTGKLPQGVTIASDGHSLIIDSHAQVFQHLRVGEKSDVVVHYMIDDNHGGQTPAIATITIAGTDDKAGLTSNIIQMSETEAVDSAQHTYKGSLQLVDPDTGDNTQFLFGGRYIGQHYSPGSLNVFPDGSYQFRLQGALNRHANDDIQSLHAGESIDFPYEIKTSDGQTLTIMVRVTGEDSNAQIHVSMPNSLPANQSVIEEHFVPASTTNLYAGGRLHVVDPDHDQSYLQAETINTTHHGQFKISADGGWNYTIDNSIDEVQKLGAGESFTETHTVHSLDGTASQLLTVTVQGTNDAPVVSAQVKLAPGIEDTDIQLNKSDLLSNATDIDHNDIGHLNITNLVADHGVIIDNKDGTFNFHPEPNYNGQVHFSYDVIDGHGGVTHTGASTTLAAVNDAAVFSVDDTGSVKEDVHVQGDSQHTVAVSGVLIVSDPDAGESEFVANRNVHAVSDQFGGDLSIGRAGDWTYSVPNNNLNRLAEGEKHQVTYEVVSRGGDKHQIVITVVGTNDDPILSVTQTTPTTGTLTETDIDVKDMHTFSVVSSTGQFGSLSVDPDTGAYVYTANSSVAGMTYNSATHTYHGTDVFEVKVADNHGGESSKFITFDTNGHVSVVPGQQPTISTTVPVNPLITTTQPSLPTGTNTPPSNAVTLDLAASSDTGISDTDNVTKETTPTITGHTDIPYSQVTVYDGSILVGHAVSDASGQYSVAVNSLSDGDHNLSAKALAPSSVLPATSSLLSVHIDTQVHVGIQTNPITSDNVVNAQESNSSIDITGSVSGDFNAGDIVTLNVNGTKHTGVVGSHGHYSIAVPGSELITDADQKIEASIAVTDSAGNSTQATADVTYQVDTQVSIPTITFENAGADNLYSKAEIARGQANTITATVTPPGDAKIGEHLVVNGQDHVLDAHTLQHGIQIEVHPGSNVQATMTDEHGNTAGSQGFAASAIPEPIIVRPPSGSHQVSGTLGVPPLLPSLTPVPTTQSGWRIHLPNGQYVTSHHGQYGTLTIDPQTGHLHYQEQAQVHTGPHGSASGIGQHEDKFEVALQGTNQDEVVAHVNIQILSHGPGHSGKLTVGTEVVDMTITPVVHTSHPAAPPPPPPVQHDEPDMASQADFTVTLSDDSNLDLTQQTHQEPDEKTSHHGAAAYLDALGINPDATSTTVHDQPADMDIVLAQVDQPDPATHDQAHLDMSDALEHHDMNINHNQDDEHHHHNDVDGLPDIDPNS